MGIPFVVVVVRIGLGIVDCDGREVFPEELQFISVWAGFLDIVFASLVIEELRMRQERDFVGKVHFCYLCSSAVAGLQFTQPHAGSCGALRVRVVRSFRNEWGFGTRHAEYGSGGTIIFGIKGLESMVQHWSLFMDLVPTGTFNHRMNSMSCQLGTTLNF